MSVRRNPTGRDIPYDGAQSLAAVFICVRWNRIVSSDNVIPFCSQVVGVFTVQDTEPLADLGRA